MYLDNNSLIMQWNTDTNGNPVSRHIPREVQQVSPTHNLIQLTQIPDEFYPLRIITEDNIELSEVKHRNDIAEDSFSVDYGLGLVYFHESLKGKMIIINYYGRGVMLISDSRIFHRDGDTIADTWDNIIERSQDALDLIEHAGGLSNAIKVIDKKVEEGTQVADRLENFITETQFYGYTITLSREAFVVKADEDGDVGKTEISSVYTDVVVYKGAKQIVPTLTVSNEQGCSFKVEGQRVKLTSMNINFIKTNAVLNIDCGDGLVAQRVLEVTKVFDGVNQYQVSMTNPFYSFQANSEGFIEEDQTVTCCLKVTKANIEYENYQIQVQNAPQGLNYKINKDSVTFTGVEGRLLPSSGTCLVVATIDGRAYNNSFSWNKVRKGVDAKTLKLVGSQIIRYETPDFSDIPAQRQTTISAKISGLSGTPTWSFFDGAEWALLQNVTGTELTFEHNDQIIWSDRKEVTIKCELEGYSDEITIVKLANGVNGNDAITVILTNESHTVPIDDSGVVAKSEIDNSRTTVLAYKGAKSIVPRVSKGRCVGCDVKITQDIVQLISLDNSFTSSTAELIIEVDGVSTTKVWTISKSRQGLQGESGQNGSTLILNVTGGTRSVTYSQINHDPRPSISSTFVATLYVDGVEISDGLSWYWVASGHFTGTSILGTFTPTIRQNFDESVTSNNISVTVTYKGQTITQEVPLSVTKDANGLDWVQEWDDTKTDVRGNLILTPKIFAGNYDQENDLVTGVAVGQDVLNDGRTVGIIGYQNNIPSFLLDTDGSLQVGNPFEENSTGLYYSNGVFKLKVNELSIEGSKVATEDEIGGLITSEVNSAKNELEESINNLSNSLGSLEDVLNNGLQDGILTEVEKQALKIKVDTLKGESTTLTAQIGSVLVSPFLSNTTLLFKLEELSENYETTYNTLLDVYNRITEGNTPSDEDVALFNETLYTLREVSEELNQVLIDCLTDISQTQATQLVDKAKEEIKAEVDDVNNALTDLENTINGEFKVGLVTSINLANLENHLHQLAKEKADIDAQYKIIFNNKNLSNAIKQKLVQAKSDYDIVHDALVAKINSAITDNLMTEQELKEINTLIKTYATKLGTYSGVAQEANADIALRTAQGVVDALDQEAIFNKLTNNGEVQGIYLQDGKVYINGEYINSRNFKAVRNDGTETFKIDADGNVHIRATSFHLVGNDTNIVDKDYVDSVIGEVSVGSTNVIISNESQVIPTTNTRVPFTNETYTTKVSVYQGTKEITDFTINPIESANGITVSINQETKIISFSVSGNTKLSADNGFFTIPIVANGLTINKKWTWAVSKQGLDAHYVTLSGEQAFRYAQNFSGIPTPMSVRINSTVVGLQNPTRVWEFRRSGEDQWNLISTATNSNATSYSVAHDDVTIWANNCRSIVVRCSVGNVSDQITIVKVSDGAKGDKGETGATGNGIKTITNYYLATSSSSGITTSTSGWTTTIQTVSASKKYLWNYEVVTYTNNSTITSTPCIIGVYGDKGDTGATGQNADSIGVVSKNYDVVAGNGHSEFYIRGKKVANSSVTGHTVFKINKTTLTVEETTKYATYGNESACTEMANYLNGLSDCIIAIISSDACRVTDALRTAISKIGGSKTGTWGASRYSHYVIGMPGLANGQGYEEYKTGASATLSCTVPVGLGVGILTNGAQGNKGDKGDTGQTGPQGTAGKDAYTVILTNESHTFPAENNGSIASDITVTTDVLSYKGASSITPTIGTLPTVSGLTLSKTNNRVTIVAKSGTALADSGSFNIPITVDGKSFTKTFSWSKSRKGNTGATGPQGNSAKLVNISASSQVFKSTDGGVSFSPDNITLTPKFQSVSYSNWQYSTNGGGSWTNVTSGQNGLTISGSNLTISKGCALYTQTITSVVFRVNTNDSSVYDTITIVKLYDVVDLNVGATNFAKMSKTFGDMNSLSSSSWGVTTSSDGFSVLGITTENTSWQECQMGVYAAYGSLTEQTTISFEYQTSKSNLLVFNIGAYNGNSRVAEHTNWVVDQQFKKKSLPNGWTKGWLTFSATSLNSAANANCYKLQFKKNSGVVGTAKVRKVKLETGTVVSDWTNAPEDIDIIAQQKVDLQTQLSIFNKLTNNGQTQGIYLENNKLYLNGEFIKAGTINADKLIIGIADNGGYSVNSRFAKWSSTYPDGTAKWMEGGISKVTVDGKNVAQFSCSDATKQYGMSLSTSFFAKGLDLTSVQYICIEAKVRLTSGTSFNGSAILLDVYRTDNTYERLQLNMNQLGTVTTNTWYTVRKIFKLSDVNVAKTFRGLSGYVLANWSSAGSLTAKTIQFASVNFYHATQQDYLTQTWTSGTQINGGSIASNTITTDKLTANSVTADKIASNSITSSKIAANAITADMITSGTFKGTNFIAGGATNGNGYVQVLDASNGTLFQADKNGVYSKSISFAPSRNYNPKTDALYTAGSEGFHGSSTFDDGTMSSWFNYVDVDIDKIRIHRTGEYEINTGEVKIEPHKITLDNGKGSTTTHTVITESKVAITGNGKTIAMATGGSDVYIHNNKSNKYLQLKDDGTLRYSDSRLLMEDWMVLKYGSVFNGVNSSGVLTSIAKIASHGGVDLGSTGTKTAICSNVQPTWYNGSTSYQLVYSIKDSGGYPCLMSDNHGWIRTPPSGLIPNTSGTGTGRASIGSSTWRFSTGYFNQLYAYRYCIDNAHGTNYIEGGTGDGNDYTTYNVRFRTHNGLAFTDNAGNATVVVQGRQGRIMGKNAYYVNSSRVLKSDIRAVVSEKEPMVANLKSGEVVDKNLTVEMIHDFLEKIDVKTYVTDFNQVGARQEDADSSLGHSLTLGYIADEIAKHEVFKYVGEQTADGLYAINSNSLSTVLIVGYQGERRERLKLEERVRQLEATLQKIVEHKEG